MATQIIIQQVLFGATHAWPHRSGKNNTSECQRTKSQIKASVLESSFVNDTVVVVFSAVRL